MIFIIAATCALAVGLVAAVAANALPVWNRDVKARMAELELDGLFTDAAVADRTRRSTRLQDLLEYLGEQVEDRGKDWGRTRTRLIHAGYREPRALPTYLGIRFGATGVLAIYGFMLGNLADFTTVMTLVAGFVGAGIGWFVPDFMLSMRVAKRQKGLRRALPDALDLLVICVEAGLGLNQALVRVAAEMRHSSESMTEELSLTNMSIRAGTPREQALMDLSDRTGLDDIHSLVTMIVQTERFGTSIAHSLRVHAETMRTKRRQRAEEAAAKTTIKMIFPLAFCIFPALFVVILGPALISMAQAFASLG
jgi:tight adherence protein C